MACNKTPTPQDKAKPLEGDKRTQLLWQRAMRILLPPDTTFRDPEHGGKSVPLSEDVQRKPTGTTAMGDPYTGDELWRRNSGTPRCSYLSEELITMTL